MSILADKKNNRARKVTVCFVLAGLILVGGGVSYRKAAAIWTGTGTAVVELPRPLKEFPRIVNGWQGEESAIPTTTEAYMRQNFADDFFSRRYKNIAARAWADIYVVYCASRPAGILGHRPRICYPGGGWIHDRTETSEITTAKGRTVPCLLHRFHKSMPNYMEIVVLSLYVASGDLTADEEAFEKILGRGFNLDGDYRHYVAQIQISSTLENYARQAGIDFLDTILEFLPNTQKESSLNTDQ